MPTTSKVLNQPSQGSAAAPVASAPGSKSRYYRFAVCGGSNSGKTCILAALGMARVAHPDGHSATLLPLPRSASSALKEGGQWVQAAINRLLSGEVPEQNAAIDPRMTLRYCISQGKVGPEGEAKQYFVELIDYSGELMQAQNTQDEFAEKLRGILLDMDGLLIVAEHPPAGKMPHELAPHLNSLRGALAILADERRGRDKHVGIPMALLVNKWDRAGEIQQGPDAHQIETQRLKKFLAGEDGRPPPHAALLNVVKASSDPYCEVFPVSAFGRFQRILDPSSGLMVEKPAVVGSELNSFGLEEPFLWAIEQREQMDVDTAAKEALSPWLWFAPMRAERCKAQLKATSARMSKGSKAQQTIAKLRKRVGRVQLAQTAVLVTFMFSAALGLEAAADYLGHHKAVAEAHDPRNADGWNKAEAWYESYMNASAWRHLPYTKFALSREQARKDLQELRERADDFAWAPAAAATELAEKKRLAEAYLRTNKHGRHANEANLVMVQYDEWVKREHVAQVLQNLEGQLSKDKAQFENLKTAPGSSFEKLAKEVTALEQGIQEVDLGTIANDELANRRKTLMADALALDKAIVPFLNEELLRVEFEEVMKSKNFARAGELLATKMSGQQFADLKNKYIAVLPSALEARLNSEIGVSGSGWQRAEETLKAFESVPGVLTNVLPKSFEETLASLRAKIKRDGTAFLYNEVVSNPDSAGKVEAALNAPTPVSEDRKAALLKLKTYLNQKVSTQDFRVSVTAASWPQSVRDFYSNIFPIVRMENHNAVVSSSRLAERSGTENWSAGWSDSVPQMKLSCVATQPLSVTVRIDVEFKVFSTASLGSKSVDSPFTDWEGGMREVILEGGSYAGTKVTLKVEISDGAGSWEAFTPPVLPAKLPIE